MVPGPPVVDKKPLPTLAPSPRGGGATSSSTAGNSVLRGRHPAAPAEARVERGSTTWTVGTRRRGCGGLERRLLHDDRRTGTRAVQASRSDLQGRWRPVCRRHPAHGPGREGHRRPTAELGLSALRGERRPGPLRQDGPQRHRVRPSWPPYAEGDEHPAPRQCRRAAARGRRRKRRNAAAPTRSSIDTTSIWVGHRGKCGGAAASSALLVAGSHGAAALTKESRRLANFAGRVSDSGEGRLDHQSPQSTRPCRLPVPLDQRSTSVSARAAEATLRRTKLLFRHALRIRRSTWEKSAG